ncbi:MAG: hypothetical protein JWP59_1847 [Massilia sp.]|nr:hypothetical protein [Massilia sp.]
MKIALFAAVLCTALPAFAAEPKTYTVDISMATSTGISTPRVQVKEGESFKIVTGEENAKVSASFTVSAVPPASVKLAGSVRCADGAAATPTLIAKLGEAASVNVSGPAEVRCQLTMTVNEENQPATTK